MKQEKTIMKIKLENENRKIEDIQKSNIKLYLFNFVFFLLQAQVENNFLDYLLIISQFIQLMAFPMDYIFSSGWKTSWYETIGHFFHYFQSSLIFIDFSHFYIISFFITFLYIIIFIILLLISIHKYEKYLKISKGILDILNTVLQLNTILTIPFLKILFNILICDNDNILFNEAIECHSTVHIIMIVISIISIIIYILILLLFKMIYFDFGVANNKLKAAFTSSTELLLVLAKILLIIFYQFIKHPMFLSVITLILSFFLLFDFNDKQPFVNITLNKIYLILYILFFWTSFICFVGLILKDSEFEGAIFLLLLGYPFIILLIGIREFEFPFEKIFEDNEDKYKNGYTNLIKIEYFLKLEETLNDRIRTREQKILYSYIENYEQTCTNEDCELKSFLKKPLKIENFNEMKIFLLMHAEMLYKVAISKYPFYAKLRLSYALFLYNKMNKKQQGTNEIILLSKYSSNLEDSFLIFRAQKLIENENSGSSIDAFDKKEVISQLNYNAILNNIRTIMRKITMNYIDFWTILSHNDEISNLKRMNNIGKKINRLSIDLNNNIAKLERSNLYDIDTIKLYIQYTIEILSDHSTASKYNSKVKELEEQTRYQYDEDYIFNLNFKAMSRSEEYNYIVIHCDANNFGLLNNFSLSINKIFGFTKEELIGRPLDYILPELFINPHKNLLQKKTEQFKKNNILKNNTNSKIISDFKILNVFGRNKMKYLVPIKLKNAFISTEQGKIYGVSKVVKENNIISHIDQEIAYVLTDTNFIINDFTPNSIKILNLQQSLLNLNLDITNYIYEIRKKIYFYDEYVELKAKKKKDEYKNANKYQRKNSLQKKRNLISQKYEKKKKLINWNIFNIYGKIPEDKRISRYINSELKKEFYNYNKLLKVENGEYILQSYNDQNIKAIQSSQIINKNILELKDLSDDIFNSDISSKQSKNNKDNKDNEDFNSKKNKKKTKQFYLTINEIKIGDSKIGYIFKFESTNKNNIDYYSKFNSLMYHRQMSQIIVDQNEEKSGISELSFFRNSQSIIANQIIFNKTAENPKGVDLGLNVTFIPKLAKENEFYFSYEKMSYKQIRNNQNIDYPTFYNNMKEQAEKKVLKINENDEEESEESEQSYTYSSNEEEEDEELNTPKSSSTISRSKNEETKSKENVKNIQDNNLISKNLINNVNQNQNNSMRSLNKLRTKINLQEIIQKNKDDEYNDFYHVNTDHITFFLYNFGTGFVEPIKDPKLKISQIASQMKIHKETIGKSNSAYISNPKLTNKEKRKNIINSAKKSDISENEMSTLNEKKIKLIEIEKALNSKERQGSIFNLFIFSIIVFILIIGSSIISILYNNLMKNETFSYYYLVEKSISLYKNILYEIFFVREIVSISNSDYTNIYQNDKDLYFLNITSTCNDFYLDTSIILSSLSNYFNSINEENKNKFMNKKGNVILIDKVKSRNNEFLTKEYEILIYSAFHEINGALYHISQMKMDEVDENEENIFYFLRNSLNFMLIMINEQIELIIEEFYQEILHQKYYLMICVIALIIIYILCYFIFLFFYTKVEIRKESYLSIFKDIGKDYVFDSLKKSELFSQKIHLKDEIDNNQIDDISNDFSEKDEEYNLENNDISGANNIKKIKDIKPTNTSSRKYLKKKIYHSKEKMIGLVIFFILFLVQLYTYIYYFIRLNLYKECSQNVYYNNQYYSLILFPFLSLREYLHQSNNTIMGEELIGYIDKYLKEYYMNLNKISEKRNHYKQYLPDSYNEYLEDLFNNKQCSLLNEFIIYSNSEYKSCDSLFYNLSYYGFDSITMSFIEDIRSMNYLANEILNTENDDINKKNELTNIMQNDKYKMSIIIYRFIIMKVIEQSIEELFDAVRINFDETKRLSLLINIIFMGFVILGFFIFWIPFIAEENEIIYKIKSMLCIIPKDILLDLPNINERLGIDGQN